MPLRRSSDQPAPPAAHERLAAVIKDLLPQIAEDKLKQAKRLGVDVGTIYRWCNGSTRPQKHHFEKLLAAAEVGAAQKNLYWHIWEQAPQSRRSEESPPCAAPVGDDLPEPLANPPSPIEPDPPESPSAIGRPATDTTTAPTLSDPRRSRRRVIRVIAASLAVLPLMTASAPLLSAERQQPPSANSSGDIHYSLQYQDSGFDLVLPKGVALSAEQEAILSNWSKADLDREEIGLADLRAELRAAGAATPVELNLLLKVQGKSDQPIYVDSVKPVDIRHTEPYNGTFLNIPPAEPGKTIKMLFNFDEITPQARVPVWDRSNTEYKPGPLFFSEKKLTIRDTDEDAIAITSITTRWAVTFKIRIDYRIGTGPSKSLTIDDHRRPFALTPMSCLDRTRMDKDGEPARFGNVTYQQIWQMREYKSIQKVKTPQKFLLGPPYC
ncbi:helix-turn-helix transcriptional regulator [Nonomuraea wenchangensis]